MRGRWIGVGSAVTLAAIGAVGIGVATATDDDAPAFAAVGSYATGLGGSGETVAFARDRMYVTNASDNSFDVVDVSHPAAPQRVRRVPLGTWGAGPNSIDIRNGLVAVAVEADPVTSPGNVVFFDAEGDYRAHVEVGSLPDMLAFSPDSKSLVVANEGEPSSYNQPDSIDPEGTVSIIDVSRSTRADWRPRARSVRFTAFNAGGSRAGELPAGVRLNGPNASVAQDVEPEYVSFHKTTAYVTLQENNAVAVIDVDRARVTKLVPLGSKGHDVAGFGLDASDRDSAINIRPWPVKGLFMPDAIASFKVKGTRYLITANEGDGRDYAGFSDERRVSALTLSLPDAATLRTNANLGRLTVSATDGVNAAGQHEALFAFGTRSATIWNATTGERVWDSGDMFEQVTAATQPAFFNVGNEDNTFDSRSDNKGPEPEGVAVGAIDGRTYAFVGLERVGGFIVLDISDPAAPTFVQWANNRDYTRADFGPDSGPEIIRFVPANRSPSGRPTVIVANEISGSVTLYETPYGGVGIAPGPSQPSSHADRPCPVTASAGPLVTNRSVATSPTTLCAHARGGFRQTVG